MSTIIQICVSRVGVIDVILDKMTYLYSNENGSPVVICVPTGIAAFQISGTILHRHLKL